MNLRNALLTLIPILASSVLFANDFPTQARVEYVLNCMKTNGGQSYNTMYPCVCSVDKIAEKMTYDQYEYAQTLSVMIKTPGERGGAFRDAPGARDLVKTYKAALEDVTKSCFVNSGTLK